MLTGLHLAWVRETDVPRGEGWLSRGERDVLARLKLPKRRADWLLGRWAAKRAVSSLLGRPAGVAGASAVEIVAAEDGRPLVLFPGDRLGDRTRAARPAPRGPPATDIRISISHAGGVGFAAASPEGTAVGCDVEVVEPRSEAFVSDYLTDRESVAVRRASADDAALMANLIWSAKESALKALGEGLRMDTRSVEVDVDAWHENEPRGAAGYAGALGWRPLSLSGPSGTRFVGSWRLRHGLVWTVLALR